MSCTVHAKFYLPIHAGDFGIWIRQTCSHYVLVHPLKIRFWACSHTSKPDFTKEHQWCLGRSYLMFFSLLTPLPLSGIEMLCMWAQQGDLKKCFNFSNKVSSAAGNTLQISWFLNLTVSSDWKDTDTYSQHTRNRIYLFLLLPFWLLQHFEIKASKQRCWSREGI